MSPLSIVILGLFLVSSLASAKSVARDDVIQSRDLLLDETTPKNAIDFLRDDDSEDELDDSELAALNADWTSFNWLFDSAKVSTDPHDPKVVAVTLFFVDQYNKQSSDKALRKEVTIRSATVAKSEFYYVTFDLGVTTCMKPGNGQNCPLDPSKPVKTCHDVIIWLQDYKEHKMRVTGFADCKP